MTLTAPPHSQRFTPVSPGTVLLEVSCCPRREQMSFLLLPAQLSRIHAHSWMVSMLLLPPRHPTPTFRPFYPQLSQNPRLPNPQSFSPTPTGASAALRLTTRSASVGIPSAAATVETRVTGAWNARCRTPVPLLPSVTTNLLSPYPPCAAPTTPCSTLRALLTCPRARRQPLPALSLAHMGPSTVAISSLRSPTT